MRLPKDTSEWTPRHLERALVERDNAFLRYEARVDFENLAASDALFADYLRKEEVVTNLHLVCS